MFVRSELLEHADSKVGSRLETPTNTDFHQRRRVRRCSGRAPQTRFDPDVLSRLGLGSLGIGFRALEEWSLTRNLVDDIESRWLQIQLNVLFCVRVRACVCVCVCVSAVAQLQRILMLLTKRRLSVPE